MGITAQYVRINQQEFRAVSSDQGELLEVRLLELFREPDKLLDLDKEWEEMHTLLTGESLTQNHETVVQSMLRSNLNQAAQNPSFPKDSLIEIEEAATAVKEIEQELRKLLRKTPWQSNAKHSLAEQKMNFAPGILTRQLVVIAGLRTHCPDEFIARCYNDLVDFARGAKSVQAFLTDMLIKLRAKDYSEIMEIGDRVRSETYRLHDLQQKLIKVQIDCQSSSIPKMTQQTTHQKSPSPLDQSDLLSMAISGGAPFPGTDSFSYINVEQVIAINEKLQRVTYKELASTTDIDIDDFEARFQELKKFYFDAAKENQVVICMFG